MTSEEAKLVHIEDLCLRNSLDVYIADVILAEGSHAGLVELVNNLAQIIRERQVDDEAYEAKIATLEAQLDGQDGALYDRDMTIDELKQEIDDLQQEIEQLEVTISGLKNEIYAAQNEND